MQPIAAPLLQWFNANKRLLPFRQEPSAYHIWVSEIMLQQTRVAAAIPYYERFIAALPDPAALAACEPDALRKLWQGLGYYNRVNNMQKAARIVCEQYGGNLPADYDALRSLPGIGDYTAGAVASIAFGIPVPAVDGNVLRVFARLYNDDADVMTPAAKKAFTVRVVDQMPKATPGPYNEALMELGALVCVPGAPRCEVCPLAQLCQGYAAGRAAELPVKPAPKAKGRVPVTVALIESERAFSSDAGTAAAMAAAMADGLRQNGILPTLKHFPGHGDTAEDSHTALAVTYKTQEELASCELLPFGADTGLHAVMVGHIAAPNVTGSDTPATLSPQLVAMIPNAEHTLIITDSLAMDAIADAYTPGEAAVLALQAGCDVLLMPNSLQEAYAAVLEAVQNGTITQERLDQSVNNILRYKEVFTHV